MRILLVTPMPPQQEGRGAIPIVLHAQLAGLIPRHQVTLVTVAGLEPGEQAAIDGLRSDGIEVHAIRRTEPGGLRRWQRRWQLGSTWLKGAYPWRTIWFWEPGLQAILDGLLVQKRFDLVAVEDNSMGIYHYRTDLPTLITEHEVRQPRPVDWQGLAGGMPLRWALSELDWRRWPRYQRYVWSQFERIQVFTRRDAEAIGRIAPDLVGRVRVNPFGIPLPALPNPGQEIEGQLLFVGNYTHPPNVEAALWLGYEIMPRLRKRMPGVCLNLVGMYPPRHVRMLAGEDIRVTGPVPRIGPYLERAAVVMAPVRSGGGMRMKVLQAMAYGKAVVTTPLGAGGMDIAGQPAPLAIGQDCEEIVEQTIGLLSNAKRRRALGERAREFVAEHFSVQAYARRLEEVFIELAGARTG